MTNPTTLARTTDQPDAATLEQVLLSGDLARLSPAERIRYYSAVCSSLGLNPLTKPLEYITLEGKLRLYVRKDGTEQLRRLHGVSITQATSDRLGDVFVVTATAKDRHGRTDVATGAVAIGTLKGSALADALMKAETKAKRRVTLSICGLGLLDESEVADAIPPSDVDPVTGEQRDAPHTVSSQAPVITDAQRRRLFAIARTYGWGARELKVWLREKFHCESTGELPAAEYDAVCTALEGGPAPPAPPAVADPDQPF